MRDVQQEYAFLGKHFLHFVIHEPICKFSLIEWFFVEQAPTQVKENENDQLMALSTLYTIMYELDHHRCCWRYKDQTLDLASKFPMDVNPYDFERRFMMTFECFTVMINWLVEKCNDDPTWQSPWSTWLHSRRSSCRTPETTVTVVVPHCSLRNMFDWCSKGSTYLLCIISSMSQR